MIAAWTRITWSILLNTVVVKLSTYFRDARQPVRGIAAPTESPDALPLNSIKFARTFVREITELGYFRRAARLGRPHRARRHRGKNYAPLAVAGTVEYSRGKVIRAALHSNARVARCPLRAGRRTRTAAARGREREQREKNRERTICAHGTGSSLDRGRAFAWRGNDAPSFRGLGLTYSARKAVARKTSGLRVDTGKSLITEAGGITGGKTDDHFEARTFSPRESRVIVGNSSR